MNDVVRRSRYSWCYFKIFPQQRGVRFASPSLSVVSSWFARSSVVVFDCGRANVALPIARMIVEAGEEPSWRGVGNLSFVL